MVPCSQKNKICSHEIVIVLSGACVLGIVSVMGVEADKERRPQFLWAREVFREAGISQEGHEEHTRFGWEERKAILNRTSACSEERS